MGLLSFLVDLMGPSPARRPRRSPSRTRTAARKRTAAPQRTASSSAEHEVARAVVLNAKGARRTAAEDREFAHLIQKHRNPANKARWDVFVGGIHRYTFPTKRGADGAAARIRKENGPTIKITVRERPLRNPTTTPAAVKRAQRASATFHGTKGEAYKLDRTDRKAPPRVVVALGEVTSIEYKPSGRSRRGTSTWRHVSGDRGDNAPRARKRPLLVADPKTGRPFIVPNGSPQKFSQRRGLVG